MTTKSNDPIDRALAILRDPLPEGALARQAEVQRRATVIAALIAENDPLLQRAREAVARLTEGPAEATGPCARKRVGTCAVPGCGGEVVVYTDRADTRLQCLKCHAFRLPHPDDAGPPCESCRGRGWVPHDDVPRAPCGACEGTGYPKSWAADEIRRLDAENARLRNEALPPRDPKDTREEAARRIEAMIRRWTSMGPNAAPKPGVIEALREAVVIVRAPPHQTYVMPFGDPDR
jgi:hypothetical protein